LQKAELQLKVYARKSLVRLGMESSHGLPMRRRRRHLVWGARGKDSYGKDKD